MTEPIPNPQTIAEAAELAAIFKNPIEFSKFIENGASEAGVGVLEYLAFYVTQNSFDEEEAANLLTPALKNKIFDEAKLSHSMPKRTETELFE